MVEVACLSKVFSHYGLDTSTSTVLDIGFGNGKFTTQLSCVFKEVVAIDKQSEAVNRLKQTAAQKNLSNLSVKNLEAKNIHLLGDNKFDMIIARNSLHFIPNIQKFYDDIKFLLKSHGVFIKISNPLFDLAYEEDIYKSSLIDAELKSFTEAKFKEELEDYWQSYVKQNFVNFCDPFRTHKEVFIGPIQEFELKTSRHLHLLPNCS